MRSGRDARDPPGRRVRTPCMPRRLLAALAVAALAVAALVVPPAGARSVRTARVTIADVSFKPSVVRIHRGDRVRWSFEDGPYTSHNVTSRGTRRFKSSSTRKTGAYTVTFRHRGTYRYVCTIHPNMRGKVVVR